ncbi:MAG: signal peptide peptidase SppA [Azoarcus sp.]|jgi:protease-4|nr:signal peptide peptidase SppA [Azoarcus sp.]
MMGKLLKIFRALWSAIDGVRRFAVNFMLLAVVVMVIAVLLRPGPTVPDGAALIVHPTGELVEQTTFDPSFAFLASGGEESPQTTLASLLDAVRAARDDARIKLLVLETDEIDAAGLSKLGELRAAIADFKASGKPVLARGEKFMQGQYYLASIADEVHLAPDGIVLLPGLARFSTYFRNAFDKLGIKVHVFRVGEYKSFAEPFTRGDMSDEDREATRSLLDGLWSRIRAEIAAARKLPPEKLDGYVLHYRDALKAAAGNAGQAAQSAGLIDRFSTREQWRARIKERLGDTSAGQDFRYIGADAYLAAIRHKRPAASRNIAVLVAQGAIADGEQPPGTTGGDSFARLIREARENPRVNAIVIRIDSPGGSAWASEIIRHELELTRQAGKPVIASMSSLAASGGYWIATGADEIFAEPSTITGSIGIFALFPEFSEPFAKLGLTIDGVATAPLAGAFDPRRPLDPEAAEILQLGIEHGYKRFLDIVAKARKMKPEEVDRIARGRVWSGAQAVEAGLVDHVGGIGAALEAAAKRANLDQYRVVWPAPHVPPLRMLMRQILSASALGDAPAPSPASRAVEQLAADLKSLTFWNDPRHIYAHCLCETP